jgi:hypothetical protein
VIFYLATPADDIECYKAGEVYAKHPEWQLHLDNGTSLGHGLNYTIAAAREWWAGIPLSGDNGTGLWNGTKVSDLIDGVLCDSACFDNIGGISVGHREALYAGKKQMMGDLQDRLTKVHIVTGTHAHTRAHAR